MQRDCPVLLGRFICNKAASCANVHPCTFTERACRMQTKLFKNGHSQAVRIPASIAYANTEMPLEIERIGEEIRIRPAQPSLDGVLELFAQFSSDFMAGGRGEHKQAEREAL